MNNFIKVNDVLQEQRQSKISKILHYVDKWAGSYNEQAKNWLSANQKMIAKKYRKPGKLYRGLTFEDDQKLIDVLMNNGKLRLNKVSSWTRSKKVAENFAKVDRKKGKSKFGMVISYDMGHDNIVIDLPSFITTNSVEKKGVEELGNFEFESLKDIINSEQEVLAYADKPLDKSNVVKVFKDGKEVRLR